MVMSRGANSVTEVTYEITDMRGFDVTGRR